MIDVERLKVVLFSIRDFFRNRVVKIVLSLFAILFAVAVLGLLLYREKDALLNYSWRIRPEVVAVSFLLYFIDLLLVVWAWALIMRSLGSKVNFWQHFRSFSIANIAKRLPGTVWYVIWRGEIYKQDGLPVKLTALASGVELAVSVFGGVFASILFAIPILSKYPAGTAALAALFMLCLILLHPRTLAKILKLLKSDIQYFSYKRILEWIGIYFIAWVLGGVFLFSVANIVYTIDLQHLGYVIGTWSVIGISSFLLFFLPSNMGFNEIGISLLLSILMPSSFAVIIAVFSRIIILIYEIVLAAVCWAIELRNKRG